ncbi:MAG: fibronectin type III domain-containing protein, partial [Paludibacteraceae bacterium]|nr:fibronectin type III domain-containing protein [Paludibacteraceae bacterium]
MRRLFTLLLISMLPILAMGQNGTVYPIDLSVMMTPPYGTCLKEYVGSDRIVVQALLKDFSKKSEQFVVQLKVTDNRNRVVLLTNFGGYDFPAGKTFTYPMGPNADQGDKNNVLHQLFENAKIQPKNECFEEGAYTFEFQAFQAASYPSRKIALSMPFRYPVFLQGNTVQPLQIYPYENEVICSHAFEYTNENGIKRNATQLGGIAYQWQSANPTGMRVGYLLQVVDLGLIGDKKWSDIKSEAGGIFGRVDKESYRVNELTYAPFYNHAFSAGNYEENHAYAWRVLALLGKDLELGKNASVNDNNAPVRVFYFCGAPGIEKDDYEVIKDDREFDKNLHKVKMDTVKSTDLNALALWRDSSVKDAYCGVNVEIRKKGQEKWTPYFVEQTNKYDESIDPTDNSYTFTNLSYNTRYEVRAQYVKCENCAQRPTGCVYAPYSDILEFVIAQPIDSATCGQNLPKLADCGEGVKAPRILAGDTIIANGTKVVVDSVSYPNASDSSIISGKGHICMPIVKNIQLKMEFNEITINCAKELVKGKVVSVWDDKTCAMIDIDELGGQNSTGGTDNTASDATVEEYDPSTANDKPAGTLMVDKDGTVKFKTKDGKIEDIGKSITLSAQEYQSKGFLSDNAHYIEFYNEDKENNAFDNNAQGYYDKISKYEYFDSPLNKVVLPWLANNPGKLKKIKAREVKKKETIASFESVMFVIPSGDSYIQLDAKQDKDGNYDLQIPGWADVDYSTPIYAIARNSAESSYFDAGKMMQANYAERTH